MGLFSSSASSKTSNTSDQSFRPNQQKDIGAAQIQIGSGKKIGLNISDSRDFSDKRVFVDSRKFIDSSVKNSGNKIVKNSGNSFSDSRSFADSSRTTTNVTNTTTDFGAVQGAFNNNYKALDRTLSTLERSFNQTSNQLGGVYQGFTDQTEIVHQQLLGNAKKTGDDLDGMGDTLVKLFAGLVAAVVSVVWLSRARA